MEVDKIMTLHPEGKQGVNIDKEKYIQMKNAIVGTLEKNESLTTSELLHELESDLQDFDGKIGWYMMSVKLDLEARKVISHDRRTRLISLVK